MFTDPKWYTAWVKQLGSFINNHSNFKKRIAVSNKVSSRIDSWQKILEMMTDITGFQ